MDWESQVLKSLVDDIKSNRLILPTLPDVAIQVRDIMSDPNCSVKELANAINHDTALTARLIKVTNSALHRASQPIDDVRKAITRLGMDLVRSLVTQLALIQTINCYASNTTETLKKLTDHSIAVGAACHALATHYTNLNPEEAMLAGLVHDIGKLPIIKRLRELLGKDFDPEAAEPILRKLHAPIGAMILKAWHFAPELITVCEEHEDLMRDHDGPIDYTDLVIVANLIEHLKEGNPPPEGVDLQSIPIVLKLGLSPATLFSHDEQFSSHTDYLTKRMHA